MASTGVRRRFQGRFAGLSQPSPWASAGLVLALLAGCWALVYSVGGSHTAFPHAFYIPIVLAAVPFGPWGGVAVGLLAMLLCGPVMPMDVATGEGQEALNWLIRGGFFITVGGLAGISTRSLRRRFEDGLTQQLLSEIELANHPDGRTGDPSWEQRIRRTLAARAFHPVYQPIYTLGDGQLLAVEALTRFAEEPREAPDVWFRHAAAVGLGVELELATLAAALEGSPDLPDDVALTFNASPALLADARLERLLAGRSHRSLIAEITEHVVVDDYRELSSALARLRAKGLRLAVDDAGAGFASLRHIVRLEPDFIKLDPSLTQNVRNDPVRRPLADCLVQFAHRTDSRIIVEGIESAADLQTWRELGADAAQGFLLGRPGPCTGISSTTVLDAAPELHAGTGRYR